ncbi:Ca2+ regulator and membrane fusion protein Fig1-domain-containing protein [Podospora didyma]|uniref:Ca2+ regulator and membrane fusion protein Fig1-domain-containing protein n=1 Tax=Podospora didyma TaxID=330526 RepID=A0AAE0NYW6_9PEZI|nr:Ca2+ regulator and membrane fusion protein Fig1-domain-containing protein [Podospora didyma]
MILAMLSIILLSILVAGCTSESLSGVYLLSLSYTNSVPPATVPMDQDPTIINPGLQTVFAAIATNNGSSSPAPLALEVRVGYMGMCLSRSSGGWFCSTTAASLASYVRDTGSSIVNRGGSGDPLNLIHVGDAFKGGVVFMALIIVSMVFALFCIALMATFPGWHQEEDDEGSEREVKPFPSESVSRLACASSMVSAALAFVSAFWQHLSSAAAGTMVGGLTYGAATAHTGVSAIVLGWMGTSLILLVVAGLVLMILSFKVLRQIMD